MSVIPPLVHVLTNQRRHGRGTKIKEGSYHAQLTIPVLVSKERVEYVHAHFLIVCETNPEIQKVSVHATGVHIVFNSKTAKTFATTVARLKGQIDAGVLDKLISDSFFDSVVKPLDDSVAFGLGVRRGGSGSRTWMDFLAMVGQHFGSELAHASGTMSDGEAASEKDAKESEDTQDSANDMMIVGGALMAAATAAAAAAGPLAEIGIVVVGAGAAPAVAIAGAGFFLIGAGVYFASKYMEYPQYADITPPQVEGTLALMASLLGSRSVSNYIRRVVGVGGSVDAPERQSDQPFFFGWMPLDAWIIALLREVFLMNSGAPVSTPTGETSGPIRVIDPPRRWVRDPGWNPYFIQAALEASLDRKEFINGMASRLRAKKI